MANHKGKSRDSNTDKVILLVENVDYVVCQICSKQLKKVGNHVITFHKMDMETYKRKFPDAKTLCEKTIENLTKAHKGKKNWFVLLKEAGQDELLKAKIETLKKKVAETIMNNPAERARRSKLLGDLNKTDEFRKRASETAIETSKRKDLLEARTANLQKWRLENEDKWANNIQKGSHFKTSKPEKKLLEWIQKEFPDLDFRGNQSLFHDDFTTPTKRRQIDILSRNKNIIVEYDGFVHFKNVAKWNQLEEAKKQDKETNKALSKSFLLIRVAQSNWHERKGFKEETLQEIKNLILDHITNPNPKLVCCGKEYKNN